jgi:hypothetical protein
LARLAAQKGELMPIVGRDPESTIQRLEQELQIQTKESLA